MRTYQKVLLVIGILFAIAAIIIAIVFYATSGLTGVINNQLKALRNHNIEQAYSYNSIEFQNATSLDEYKDFVNHFTTLKNNQSVSITQREVNSDGTGILKGTLTAKDGTKTQVEYRLIKENSAWKILYIHMMISNMEGIEKTSDLSNTALSNLFEDKNNRYTIKYPANWEYKQPNKGAVVFRGKKASEWYHYTVDIETILGKKIGGKFSNVDQFMRDLKSQYSTHTTNVNYLEEGPISITKTDGSKIVGKYIIFSYTYQGYNLKQWQIIILRNADSLFYLWAYTAPKDQYDTGLALGKAMLDSWSIY